MTTSEGPTDPRLNSSCAAQCGKRILFVEDHEATQTTITRLLRRRGFEVIAAHSLADARRCVAEMSFDLIISDLGLPDGDGCDLMKELQAGQAGYPLGVAISGFGMENDVCRARASGFTEHLTKPITMEHLERVLRRLF